VYTVPTNGGVARQLTNSRWAGRPAWSPDGQLIGFTKYEYGEGVFVMRPDGRGQRTLARMKGSSTEGVKWSPDGQWIAFARDHYLWLMRADGTQARRLVDSRVDYPGWLSAEFAWSPDSSRIAFSKGKDHRAIFIVNTDGTGLRRLTANRRANDLQPAWSPDGQRIAFISDRDGNTEIYVMSADGSDQRNISQSPGADVEPAWSPQ
jgi:TolB protein